MLVLSFSRACVLGLRTTVGGRIKSTNRGRVRNTVRVGGRVTNKGRGRVNIGGCQYLPRPLPKPAC